MARTRLGKRIVSGSLFASLLSKAAQYVKDPDRLKDLRVRRALVLPAAFRITIVYLALSSVASGQSHDRDRLGRLEVLADVWSKAYIYHPRVASGEIDYNGVLLKAIPLVERASNDTEFVRILNDYVLGPLQDPLTSAQLATRDRCGLPPSGPVKELETVRLSPSIAMVRVRDPRIQAERINPFVDRFRSAVEEVGHFTKLIVDLRYAVDAEAPEWTSYWFGLFTDKLLDQAHYLHRVHEGLNEFNSPNNAYRQRWQVDGGDVLPPAMWSGVVRKPILTPVLFLVNRTSYGSLARTLDSLQRAGRAAVVSDDSGCVVGVDVQSYPGPIRVRVNSRKLVGGGPTREPGPDRLSSTSLRDDEIAPIAEATLARLSTRLEESLAIPSLRLRPYVASTESLADRNHRLTQTPQTATPIR